MAHQNLGLGLEGVLDYSMSRYPDYQLMFARQIDLIVFLQNLLTGLGQRVAQSVSNGSDGDVMGFMRMADLGLFDFDRFGLGRAMALQPGVLQVWWPLITVEISLCHLPGYSPAQPQHLDSPMCGGCPIE